MRRTITRSTLILAVVASFLVAASPLAAQDANQEEAYRLANQIRKKILMLSNYGVYDYITFGLKPGSSGYIVVLNGYASRPTLQKSADRVVSKLEGVEAVENQIEVLPNSNQDESIRARAYAAIYGHATLSRYNPNRGTPMYGASRRLSMGISNDPPRGYHPIAIIVKQGNITLMGVVDNDMDKQIAGVQANSVSGAFSVTNNLGVLNPKK